MANHASTEKAIRKTVKRTAVNKSKTTRIRTYIKKVLVAVQSGNKDDANKAFLVAQSEIMRGVSDKLLKKNTGSRKVSRLAKKVKEMAAA